MLPFFALFSVTKNWATHTHTPAHIHTHAYIHIAITKSAFAAETTKHLYTLLHRRRREKKVIKQKNNDKIFVCVWGCTGRAKGARTHTLAHPIWLFYVFSFAR